MGGGRFGTMGTHRDSLPWGRLSLLLLLLGLALPPATAQVLSYKEAVLRAVEGFNQRSSEASLYRLLDLDQQLPDGVSWGGCQGGRLWASQVGHTATAFAHTGPSNLCCAKRCPFHLPIQASGTPGCSTNKNGVTVSGM